MYACMNSSALVSDFFINSCITLLMITKYLIFNSCMYLSSITPYDEQISIGISLFL